MTYPDSESPWPSSMQNRKRVNKSIEACNLRRSEQAGPRGASITTLWDICLRMWPRLADEQLLCSVASVRICRVLLLSKYWSRPVYRCKLRSVTFRRLYRSNIDFYSSRSTKPLQVHKVPIHVDSKLFLLLTGDSSEPTSAAWANYTCRHAIASRLLTTISKFCNCRGYEMQASLDIAELRSSILF